MTNKSKNFRKNAYQKGYRYTTTYITRNAFQMRFFKNRKQLEDFTAHYMTLRDSTGIINEAGHLTFLNQ